MSKSQFPLGTHELTEGRTEEQTQNYKAALLLTLALKIYFQFIDFIRGKNLNH